MSVSQRIWMAFQTTRSTFRITRGYTFIWDKLQWLLSWYEPILDLDGGSQECDWIFVGNMRLIMIWGRKTYKDMGIL